MNSARDDDALTWDGDDDPTLDAGVPAAPVPTPVPRDDRGGDARADGADAEASARADEPAPPAEPTPLGNAALVGIGMIAAAFILFSVGWLIVALRLRAVSVLVPEVTLTALTLAAAAAPLVWFVTVYALTRYSRTWVRFAWMLAGVVLLVPWPFLITGAFA